MEQNDSEVPPLPGNLKVGIIYNLKKGIRSEAADIEAEYDSIKTVYAIKRSLEAAGCTVCLLEADRRLPDNLAKTHIDLAFNIAEGFSGRGREAQIPALLGMYGIPYTGSDETTLCLALDKAITKRYLSTYNIRSPKSVLITKSGAKIGALHFPVIVKPNAEGSSKGIGDVSVVRTKEELNALTGRQLDLYREELLAEEYISGREFTVGIVGNGKNAHVFSPMEIKYGSNLKTDFPVYSYSVKQDYKKYITYECPPALDEKTEKEMKRISLKIYKALGCRDFSRIDFRMGSDGKLYFIEINPLPGLAPEYSDYPMLAAFCGTDYDALIRKILVSALSRYGIGGM